MNNKLKTFMPPKNIFFIFIVLVFCNIATGDDFVAKKNSSLIESSSSFIGTEYNETFLTENQFTPLFPEKNGEILFFKRLKDDDFWEVCLIYIKDKKYEAITYAIVADFVKSKQNYKNIIIHLIKVLGEEHEVHTAKLDSVISKDLQGFAIIWKKNNTNIALKFGPLEKEAAKFQLQMTIFNKDCKIDLLNINKERQVKSADHWRKIQDFISQ